MIGVRRLRRGQPRFDSALAAVADATRTPTEVIEAVETPAATMVMDPEPEPEMAPEPEPLPEAGLVVLPTMCGTEQWLALFGREPAPSLPMGHVDVTEAVREQVEEFLGADFVEWLDDGRGVMVHAGGRADLAHMGDRLLRDENGLHVQCTRAFGDWETGAFEIADAVIAAGDAV